MKVNRREFVRTTTAASVAAATSQSALGAASAAAAQSPTMITPKGVKPCVVASANGNRSSSAFGSITSTYPARQIQLGIKLYF